MIFTKNGRKKKIFFKTISKNEKDFSFSILELFLKSLIFKDDIIENEKLILISEGVAHHHPHATIYCERRTRLDDFFPTYTEKEML